MRRSLRSWLWRVPIAEEVDEELAFHAAMRARERGGHRPDPEEIARLRRALVAIARKRDRQMRVTQWLDELLRDVRLSLRQLRAAPGFAAVAVVTLALGIGANAALFALADAALLRPLPFTEDGRLVMLWQTTPDVERSAMAVLDYPDIKAATRTLAGVEAVVTGAGGGPLLEAPDGSVESAERQVVSRGFFDLLGVRPIVGRTFQAVDEGPNPTVVVLTERVWRTRFGADPEVSGRRVRLNGQPFTVVGVVPDNAQFMRPAAIWTMIQTIPNQPQLRAANGLLLFGRMKPGVTVDAAQQELATIAAQLARQYPETNTNRRVTVEPLRDGIVGRDLTRTSQLVLAIVGFVLLMCCANVANLLLARATARERELAVRAALGAGRGRIVAQLLTESLVLAAIGGGFGLGVAALMLRAAPAVIPPGLLAPVVTLAFDARVVWFVAGASLVVGLVFGLLPSWQVMRPNLVRSMASESRSTTRGGGRMRGVLVSAQIAVAVLLLCGAGLFTRTLLVLVGGDEGYRAAGDSVMTLDFSVPSGPNTPYPTPDRLLQFYDTVSREVRALPEVRDAGWTSSLPYGMASELGEREFVVDGQNNTAKGLPDAEYTVVDPGYFRTLGLPLVAGRGFTPTDSLGGRLVCIVNEEFARRVLPGRDPIGVRIALPPGNRTPPVVREIIGVAAQVSGQPDAESKLLQVYVPLAQQPTGDVFMVVQPKDVPAAALVPLVRRVVARHNPNLSVRRERTLQFLSVQSTAGYRFRAGLVVTLAALALVLAMVGVFGVLAYSVQQRRREFGVRIALGASGASVLRLVLAGAGRLIGAGAIVGLLMAVMLARTVSTFLFGVQPIDPLTFGAVVLLLVSTAGVAAALPAIRASRTDPVVAFRND